MLDGPTAATDSFLDAQCDYRAAKRSSRFQRKRRGIPPSGASGDYHYRNEGDYLWMGEAARDMDRNDIIVGSIVDKVETDTIGGGFTPQPNTGDKGLDHELKERWTEESLDPDYCDVAGELCFCEQEAMALREMLVAGDVFGVPIHNGTVELREFHRCRSPNGRSKRNIVHGIELEPKTRKKLNYYFTREEIDPHKPQSSVNLKDLLPVEARDADGEANVWHVYRPKRPTQTRGVTSFNPLFEIGGMHDDLQFAQVLKAQLAAFFLLLRNRDKSFFENNPEEPLLGTKSDFDPLVEDLRPGAQIRGGPGEVIQGFAPRIPNAEFFPHVKLILTLLGINLGLPLVLVLMDASETNFSGWRGAVDAARRGFQRNQRNLALRFHRPYWRFKLNYWADNDPGLAAWREKLGAAYLRHRWGYGTWPYIEPTKDATADVIRDANLLTSPRRRCQERNSEWEEIVAETVEDRGLAIERAIQKAQAINETYKLVGGEQIRWRDLAPLAMPERVSVAVNANAGPEGPAKQSGRGTGESDDA